MLLQDKPDLARLVATNNQWLSSVCLLLITQIQARSRRFCTSCLPIVRL